MELFTPTQLRAMADPEWLIERLFPTGGLVELYGAPGSGKSWIALDWAFHIALGMPWQGLRTKQAPVVYIAAEGRGGLGQRVDAWLTTYRPSGEVPVYFSVRPCDLLGEGSQELLDTCAAFISNPAEPETDLVPGLVILDTLARCFTGGDENETADMARFVASVDRLRHELGATVLVVHHTGKDRSRDERGSNVLRAAADTMIRVKRQAATPTMYRPEYRTPHSQPIRLSCSKQKDAAEFEDITLQLEPVGKSCVIASGFTVEQAVTVMLADTTLVSVRARARRVAELTRLPVETCRNHLRSLA